MENKSILLIEDDKVLMESTTIFLVEEGYEVITARNGLEGIERAMEYIPNLVLCDIAMPRMNGYEVYKILSENSATCFIPFIFLSAKTEKEDVRLGMQMGADDYITKPFDYDELLKTIELRIAKREKLLSVSENGFKALLDSSLNGIFIIQNKKLSYANSKLVKILGYSKKDFLSLNLFKIIHKDDRANVEEKIQRCFKGILKGFNVNFRAYSKDNELLHLECWGGLSQIYGQDLLIANVINVNEYRILAKNEHNKYEENNKYFKQKTENLKQKGNEEPIREQRQTQNPDGLTRREIEILQLICQGLTNNEIAEKLFVSVRTIDTHRINLLSKTGLPNTAGLVVYAIKNNLFSI